MIKALWTKEIEDEYWMNKFKALPFDIQKHIIVLEKNNDTKIIEITKKLYKSMSRDLSHDEEFKPYYAFAKMVRDLTRGYWYGRR